MGITINRDILLVQIDRRCFFPDCGKRNLVGLTKAEARKYCGFECTHCKRWNEDVLSEQDVPESWKRPVAQSN